MYRIGHDSCPGNYRVPDEHFPMTRIVTAVVLSFLFPGFGQYYNRDYRKGSVVLIFTTLIVLLPLIWIFREAALLMPADLTPENAREVMTRCVEQVVTRNSHALKLITFLYVGVWAYAITESYFKAKETSDKEEPKEDGP